MVTIVQKDSPVLREVAKSVPLEEIPSPKIQKILLEMAEALEGEIDGVAIAAPQIDVPLRIFIVSHRAFEITNPAAKAGEPKPANQVFINPKIIKLSAKKHLLEEGCLSVRNFYGKIERAEKATVEAWNERGEKFSRGASGLLAQIFQHETDHLDGRLFIDNATEIEEISPEELAKYRAELKAKRSK